MANEIIRPSELPVRTNPVPSEVVPSDNNVTVAGVSWEDGVNAAVPPASQSESEAGVINSKRMTPLTTKQAIDAQVPPKISAAIGALNLGSASQSNVEDFATAAQGAKADSAVQPGNPALLPAGGSTSQVLIKSTNSDYDTEWATSAAATAVSYAPQVLTDEQKLQAQSNISLTKFKTVPLLLADTSMSYDDEPGKVQVADGDIITAQGFRYDVAASGATDAWLIETAGGVKLLPLAAGGDINLLAFGASAGASAAANSAALGKWLAHSNATGARMVAAPVRLDFASTFTLTGNQVVDWNGLELVKQFDGDGVVFAGGPSVIYSHGRLFVEKGAGGSGPAGSGAVPENTTAGVNDADVGIVIYNRMINFGELISWYNQGAGIELRSDPGNMNSARFGFLRAQFNGSHGIVGSGTRDDISLVSLRARIYGNWLSGFYIPDTFKARSWMEVFITAESNSCISRTTAGVGGVPEIYLGNVYADGQWVMYGENQPNTAASIPEIEIGPNSEYFTVINLRPNRYANNSLKPWSIQPGWKYNLLGTAPSEGFSRGGSVTIGNASRYISRKWIGSSNTSIMERKIFGDGAMHFIPYAGEAAKVGFLGSGDLELFGTNKAIFMRSANGTRYRLRVSDTGELTIVAIP